MSLSKLGGLSGLGGTAGSSLVCARCGSPVSLARCASCRYALDQLRAQAVRAVLSWVALVAGLLAVLVLSLTGARALAS